MNKSSALLQRGILIALVSAVGCGDDGVYSVIGKATFQGEPIPVGEVRMSPDATKGNSGPGVIAIIVDGKYRTPPGRGVVGGPYKIEVSGFSKAPASNDPTAPDYGPQLFPDESIFVEFPMEDLEYNIAID